MTGKKMIQKKLLKEENENASSKLDKMLNRVEKSYQNKLKFDDFEIYRKWFEVEKYCFQNELAMGDIKRLIQFGTRFRELKGTDRNRIEESFFKILNDLVIPFHNKIPVNKPPFPINRDEIDTIAKKKIKEKLEIFLELEKFAFDSYTYKRDRDSFGGKRRAFSLEIIKNFSNYFQCPEGLELAKKSLKSKGRDELCSAFEFLKEYYLTREIDMEDEVHEQLIKISEKTKSRSMAVGALSVLVDTDQISEFEALNKIDDWKQKNYYS
jgi:hypothetical protein